MWANQDWVDMHPAKLGWNGCYRMSKATPIFGPKAPRPQLQMFDGYMDADVYRKAFKYVAETYFVQPNYYRVPTKLPNGTSARCCFFSFYQPEYVANGNKTEAAKLMDEFRAAALAVGQCLHLNHMTSADDMLKPRGVNSRTDYGRVKYGAGPNYAWPLTPYEAVIEHGISEVTKRTAFYRQEFGIDYFPTISPGFDASPRTLPSDAWPGPSKESFSKFGYPWSVSWTSNMSQWKTALVRLTSK